jgi:hypothetical protein
MGKKDKKKKSRRAKQTCQRNKEVISQKLKEVTKAKQEHRKEKKSYEAKKRQLSRAKKSLRDSKKGTKTYKDSKKRVKRYTRKVDVKKKAVLRLRHILDARRKDHSWAKKHLPTDPKDVKK